MTNMHAYARLRRSLALLFCLTLGIGAAHAADTVTYYHTDALGTPVMESNAAGVVTYAREYKPYGEQALGTAKNGPGFTAHVGDADNGLTYMQARYFDPIASRFLSADPVSANRNTSANYNRYWYANNNPYAFTDPNGMLAKGSNTPTPQNCGNQPCPEPEPEKEEPPSRAEQAAARRQQRIADEGWTVSFNPGTKIQRRNGESSYKRTWSISKPSRVGGYLVQHVRIDIYGVEANGEVSRSTREYWEAWPVAPGKRTTTPNSDIFGSGPMPAKYVHGSITWTGTATYFEGVTLPSSFQMGSVREARPLRATYSNPNLDSSKGSAPLVHVYSVGW